MAFLFITENFYLLVALYEALEPVTDFRSYLHTTDLTNMIIWKFSKSLLINYPNLRQRWRG